MEKKYRYKAFISYRHTEKDIKVAEHLHDAIERYHVPKSIRESIGFDENMDVFRDKLDLPVTDSLNDTIGNALRDSEYLIVICSTHLKESVWVEKEIEIFLRTHPRNNIFTVLVDGEPYEVIPKVLLSEEVEEVTNTGETVIIKRDLEPLSADYRSGIKNARKTELHRLVAGLLGCTYEELMLRQQKHRNRVVASVTAGVASLMVIVISYVIWSNTRINDNYNKALFNRSEYLSEESIRIKSEENNKELAIQLALTALPDGNNDMPYNPHAQYALTTALDPYFLPSDTDYSGIHYFEGSIGEDFETMALNDDGTWLAAVSNPAGLNHQYLYLWNTKKNELVTKQDMNDYDVIELFFAKEYLWVISYHGIKIYALSNGKLKKEIKSASDDLSDGMTASISFLNGKTLYSFSGDEIKLYDIDTLKTVSTIKFGKDLKKDSVDKIKVSPDDRYFAVSYSSSDEDYAQHLAVMDLDSRKILFDKEFFSDHSVLDDICFAKKHILISNLGETQETGEGEIIGYDYYPHTHLFNTVLCIDCSSGEMVWENKVSNKQKRSSELNIFQMQFRHMKVSNSDKYKDLVVVLDDNIVYFLDPTSGETVQEEKLPFNLYYMQIEETYENTDSILFLEPDRQMILNLCFDNDDASSSFMSFILSKKSITALYGCEKSDDLFVNFGNEIIQFKKGGENADGVMIDKESFSGYIDKRLSFGNYLALIVLNDRSTPEGEIEEELRIYDLEKKEILDVIHLKEAYFDFIGVSENKSIIIQNTVNDTLYKYDISTKKMKELKSISKFIDKNGSFNLLDVKISNDDLILLLEKSATSGNDLYPVIYHIAEDTIEKPKNATAKLSDTTNKVILSNDGTKAYIESYNGTNKIIDLDTGGIYSLKDVFDKESEHTDWNNHQIGLYDGKNLLVYDADKKNKVIEVKDSDIASFYLTDEYLYYLELDGRINRVSIDNGEKQSSLLKKYVSYRELDLNVLDENYDNFWYFGDNIIRVLLASETERILLEIDSDTLELIGQHSDICIYNEAQNSYCSEKHSLSYDGEEQSNKIALFNCYDLNELIEKGKTYINNKELTEKQKMHYGIE